MEISPSIHLLPNELLVKIFENLPRTEWPELELLDPKFRDAVLLAWGSVHKVDLERDFVYSTSKANKSENDPDFRMVKKNLRRQIARKTEAVLKKLIDYSPRITSLSGLSFLSDATKAVEYLSKFEHLKTIKFTKKYCSGQIVNRQIVDDRFWSSLSLINFVEFIETTQSRATLKEIDIEECCIPYDPIIVASFDQRLRDAFANNPNDPTRPLLQLESFSMRNDFNGNYPFNFFDTIDASNMTELSLGDLDIEPAALTTLIYGAPHLQHLDFSFLRPCGVYDRTNGCQSGRLQSNMDLLTALASHEQLSSLGLNMIWDNNGCACHRFEQEIKNMLQAIGPRLVKLVFKPHFLPNDILMAQIRDIIQHQMPNLKSITLNKWCVVNPKHLRGIADGNELEEIEIGIDSLISSTSEILHDVLSTFLSKSPHLKRFNVNYCPDQRAVAELCKLSDLIDLRIRADRLTNENFIAFSQVFAEKLEILHVGSIGEGAEPGLVKLIGKAPQLRELIVARNVTGRLLECLGKSCPNLEKFIAWRPLPGITFEGVQTLVDQCPKLRLLGVADMDGSLASSLKKELKLERYRKLEFDF